MTAPTFQRFDTADVLRLELERDPDPDAGELVNLIENTDGALGAWGWVSPLPIQTGIGRHQTGGGDWYLRLSPVTGQVNYVWSEPQAVNPALDIAASYDSSHDPTEHGAHFTRGRIQFLDDDFAVLSSSPVMAWAPNGSHEIPSLPVPDDAIYARLAVNIAKNNDGDNVTNPDAELWIRNVKLIQSGDPADLVHPLPDVPSHYMDDVIGLVQAIQAQRVPLDANTMTIALLAEQADDAVEGEGYGEGPYGLTFYGGATGTDVLDGSSLRPGKNVRLLAVLPGGATRPLFTGEVQSGRVDYDLTQPEGRRAKITLTCVDAAARMAAKKHPEIYAEPWYARAYMEGLGVPWYISYSADLPLGVATAATSDGSVLDQLIRTRDTNADYVFWVAADGTLKGYERDGVPGAVPPGTVLEDSIYNGALVVSYDTQRVINSVKVTLLHGTEETEYGPYERARSIATWGRLPGTYTLVNTDEWDAAEARHAAKAILDRSAQPALVVESATVPVLSTDVPAWSFGSIHWATLDLYSPITVTNDSPEFSYDLEVIGIRHEISAHKWLTTYTFGDPAKPALPTR